MKDQFNVTRKLLLGLAIGTAGFTAVGVQAQPAPAPAQPGQGGNRNQNMTPEQREQAMQQRQQQMRERRTEALKQNLTRNGFTDVVLQDAIVDFVNQQETAQAEVQDKARRVAEALRGNAVADTQLAVLVNEYRVATEAAAAQREVAIKALDAKINFSTKPRLDAFLLLGGITGNNAGGGMAGGRGFGGGQGGFGGGQGGFGGGQGGFGGGQGGFGGRQGGAGGRQGGQAGEQGGRQRGQGGQGGRQRGQGGQPAPAQNDIVRG